MGVCDVQVILVTFLKLSFSEHFFIENLSTNVTTNSILMIFGIICFVI